jgi:peptidyl-tRNA hydrolase
VIVRADLPLGVLAAQIVHAAGESGPAVSGTHAVALAVASELDLERVEQQLREAGIPHAAIREPDIPWANAIMAIGIPPTDASNPNLRRIVRRLRLLKERL